jgi:hypothetical protein
MTIKCPHYRECTSWEQDSLCCSYFYSWCKAYKGYEQENVRLNHEAERIRTRTPIPELTGRLNPDGSPRQ